MRGSREYGFQMRLLSMSDELQAIDGELSTSFLREAVAVGRAMHRDVQILSLYKDWHEQNRSQLSSMATSQLVDALMVLACCLLRAREDSRSEGLALLVEAIEIITTSGTIHGAWHVDSVAWYLQHIGSILKRHGFTPQSCHAYRLSVDRCRILVQRSQPFPSERDVVALYAVLLLHVGALELVDATSEASKAKLEADSLRIEYGKPGDGIEYDWDLPRMYADEGSYFNDRVLGLVHG